MSEEATRKDKVINFRMNKKLAYQMDSYLLKTGRFSNRTEFIIYLITQELLTKSIMTQTELSGMVDGQPFEKLIDQMLEDESFIERLKAKIT